MEKIKVKPVAGLVVLDEQGFVIQPESYVDDSVFIRRVVNSGELEIIAEKKEEKVKK
jgi:hypothetical protein